MAGLKLRSLGGTLVVAFALMVALLAAGCGPETTTTGVRIAAQADTPAIGLLRSNTTSVNWAAALQRLKATQSADDASRALDDLARQPDPLADPLTTAICTGMQQLGEAAEADTGANWGDFLVEQMQAQAPSIPLPEIVSRVEGVLATFDLAQVNGGLARAYWAACVAGR